MKKLIASGLILAALSGFYGKNGYSDTNRVPAKQDTQIIKAPQYKPSREEPRIKISYFDFTKMDSLYIPLEQVNRPKGLEDLVNFFASGILISNPSRFSNEVLQIGNEMGYTKERISLLSPSELIRLSADIVGKKIDYFDVDNNPEFISQHGRFLPADHYFYIGKGDCDKYANLTILTFSYLKSINYYPSNKNVYLTREFGGNAQPHAWVSVIVAESQDHLFISQIDPTVYDNNGKLEANSWHINPDYFEFKTLGWMGYFDQSNRIIDNLLAKEINKDKKAELLSARALNYRGLAQYLLSANDYESAAGLTQSPYLKTLWLQNACWEYFDLKHDAKVIDIVGELKNAISKDSFFYSVILAKGIESAKRIGREDLKKAYWNELFPGHHESPVAQELR